MHKSDPNDCHFYYNTYYTTVSLMQSNAGLSGGYNCDSMWSSRRK